MRSMWKLTFATATVLCLLVGAANADDALEDIVVDPQLAMAAGEEFVRLESRQQPRLDQGFGDLRIVGADVRSQNFQGGAALLGIVNAAAVQRFEQDGSGCGHGGRLRNNDGQRREPQVPQCRSPPEWAESELSGGPRRSVFSISIGQTWLLWIIRMNLGRPRW